MRTSLLPVAFMLACAAANAQTDIVVITLNTGFFFDDQPPHRRVVEEIRERLPNFNNLNIVFEQEHDSFNGQDVAILTTFDPDENSATSYVQERDIFFMGANKRDTSPSKILGVSIDIGNEDIYVIVAHFISRAGNNDAKLLAQANVIRRSAITQMMDGENVIIMGDMNDTPGIASIRKMRGLDDVWWPMLQTANEVPEDEQFTFVFHDEENLLDHILISPSPRTSLITGRYWRDSEFNKGSHRAISQHESDLRRYSRVLVDKKYGLKVFQHR